MDIFTFLSVGAPKSCVDDNMPVLWRLLSALVTLLLHLSLLQSKPNTSVYETGKPTERQVKSADI